MKYTAECRWFYETSPADDAIKNWFASHEQHLTGDKKRTDIYLVNNTPAKSVKLRENRLEIKINAHNWEEREQSGNAIRSNSWKKYSFELTKDDEDAAQVLRDFAGLRSIGVNHDWVRLDKERITVVYETTADVDALKIAPAGSNPEQGCTVDYTRIDVNLRKTYLSFGFEAFGSGLNVKKSLDLVLDEVFATSLATGLSKASAMAFPEFILTL